MLAENHDVHAAILGASCGRVIAGDRVVLGVTSGRQSPGGKAIMGDEEPHQLGGAGGRKFPIGSHMKGVNRDVVGVTFDADAASANRKNGCDAVERRQGGRPEGGGAAVEKSKLTQADDQAFGLAMKCDGVYLDFVQQRLFELGLQNREIYVLRSGG